MTLELEQQGRIEIAPEDLAEDVGAPLAEVEGSIRVLEALGFISQTAHRAAMP